jgi:hypothetical protein
MASNSHSLGYWLCGDSVLHLPPEVGVGRDLGEIDADSARFEKSVAEAIPGVHIASPPYNPPDLVGKKAILADEEDPLPASDLTVEEPASDEALSAACRRGHP